ncbi:hypothetical protein, partial [Plantactinospora mayteni]|uniref:hypothetical protein n=1 Tax=Plantactinospora mayteni TaxID=566021 RepID=UPI0019435347
MTMIGSDSWAGVGSWQSPTAGYDGWADSRAVRITVDDAGRVSEVELHPRWLSLVGVDGLPGALNEALTTARMSRLEVQLRELDDEPAPPAGMGGHSPPQALGTDD